MPTKHVKKHSIKSVKRSKANSSHSNVIKREHILDIINRLSQASRNISMSQSNLPSRLMKINGPTQDYEKDYKKSVSSTYSTVMQNGRRHSKGKKIVNNSTKPYIEIDEMENGDVQHYMIPRQNVNMMRRPMLSMPIESSMPSSNMPTMPTITLRTSMPHIMSSTPMSSSTPMPSSTPMSSSMPFISSSNPSIVIYSSKGTKKGKGKGKSNSNSKSKVSGSKKTKGKASGSKKVKISK